jgi:hypothetical protein
VLHYVYLTTRTLLLPMLLHFLNNALAVTLIRFEPAKAFLRDPGQIPVVVYALAGLLLAAVCWALYQGRARVVSDSPDAWRPASPGAAWPPEGSGARIERPWPSALSLLLVAASFVALAVTVVLTAMRG